MARVTVAELEALRDRVRADSLVEAVVLCAVGAVALVGLLMEAASPAGGWSWPWFWLATPLAFAGSWGAPRWRRRTLGVGTPTRALGWLTISLVVPCPGHAPRPVRLRPYPALIGGVLLVRISVQRRLMIGWALIGGTPGARAGLFFFGNRSGDLGHWMPGLMTQSVSAWRSSPRRWDPPRDSAPDGRDRAPQRSSGRRGPPARATGHPHHPRPDLRGRLHLPCATPSASPTATWAATSRSSTTQATCR